MEGNRRYLARLAGFELSDGRKQIEMRFVHFQGILIRARTSDLRRKPAIIADRHPNCVIGPEYPPRRSSAHAVSSCSVKLKVPFNDCVPRKRNIIPILGDSPAAKFKYSYADALFSCRMIYA